MRLAKRRRIEPHVWLTIEQFAVLDYLRCKEGVAQADIVEESDDSTAVIVRQVEALERRGLLRRRPLAHRDEVLELTDTGHQVLAAAFKSRD